jgi:2-polyprenyl-3-methyl-5-hydroxy-6-metoxy-1,4-benzoquinol methylase
MSDMERKIIPAFNEVGPGEHYWHYSGWKSWRANFRYEISDAEYFTDEVGKLAKPNARVLEFGFGNGRFMAWAKDRGCQVTGIEILDEMLAEARTAGYDARKLDEVSDSEFFDIIVSFSVLEHLSELELVEVLRFFANHLAPDGEIVLRFPNGGSPFGRIYQHGDLTHKQILTPSKLLQLIYMKDLPLRLVLVSNPAWPIGWRRGVKYVMLNFVRITLRKLLYQFLSAVVSIPYEMDPNLTVRLRTTSAS